MTQHVVVLGGGMVGWAAAADRQLSLDHVVGAEAQDQGGADRCDHVDRQREDRLPDRDSYPFRHGRDGLSTEPAVFVFLPSEGNDHPHHRETLVDDRE